MLIGIDFGTSYSQAAAVIDGVPYVLLEHNTYGLPSAFLYDGKDEYVGQDALDRSMEVDNLLPIRNVKMSMFEDNVFFNVPFSGQDIIKKIYGHIFDVADEILMSDHEGKTYRGVVLSVPCKFGDRERRLLTNAVTSLNRTGNNVISIIKEPVAAALSYYSKISKADGNILVFDLGGGTCDVAVVERNANSRERFEVVYSDGENIGGRDWDNRLYDMLKAYIKNETKVNVDDDVELQKSLYSAVITAKHDLSKKKETVVKISINGRICKFPITIEEFEEISIDLIRKIRTMLECCDTKSNNIKAVICVGGGSRMILIQNLLRDVFPNYSIELHYPEYAVALGNAIYASYIEKTYTGRYNEGAFGQKLYDHSIVKDKSKFSYGIRISGSKDYIYNVIMKNDPIPCEKGVSLSSNTQDEGIRWLDIYENESEEKKYEQISDAVFVGKFVFKGIVGKTSRINLKMRISEKGMIEIYIADAYGNYNSYEIIR